METLSQPSYNEVMTNLSSKLINIKASIYTSLFGEAPLKEPVDSLIFGYFVGSLSRKLNMKFTEDKLKQLFTIYKDNAKTTKDLDTLLKKTTDDFCETFYEQNNINKIVDINQIDEDIMTPQNKKEVQLTICGICLEEYNVLDVNNYYLECGCIGHKECLEAYVINCIKERIINMICPLCKKDILSSNIIYQVLNISRNKEIKEQYQSLLPQKKKKENTIPCPNPKCNYAEYKENVVDNHFICTECRKEFCLKCNEYWHTGYTCIEFQEKIVPMLKSSTSNFNEYAKNVFVHCPICKTWIDYQMYCGEVTCICGTPILTIRGANGRCTNLNKV